MAGLNRFNYNCNFLAPLSTMIKYSFVFLLLRIANKRRIFVAAIALLRNIGMDEFSSIE